MTRLGRVAAVALLVLGADVSRAQAQAWLGSDEPHFGSWEIGGGVLWSGGYDLGSRCAEETRNPGTGTGGFCLFASSSDVASATGAAARLGFYLSRAMAIEGTAEFLRPLVSTRVSGDFESAPDLTATETLKRLVIAGSLVFHVRRLTFAGGRGVPFVAGGAGYLRELHQGNELIETGHEYHAGAGLKLWFGQGARRLGVRADVAVSSRAGGFDFSDNRRTLPTAGVSLAYLF